MGIHLEITVAGEQQLARAFNRFTSAINDFTTLWPRLREVFYQMEMKQFASEGAHGGNSWVPLSQKYADWKSRHFSGSPLLVLSGNLKRQLTGNEGIYRAHKDNMEIGAGGAYAYLHQKGTSKMPSREPIRMAEGDKTAFGKGMHEWLFNEARKVAASA